MQAISFTHTQTTLTPGKLSLKSCTALKLFKTKSPFSINHFSLLRRLKKNPKPYGFERNYYKWPSGLGHGTGLPGQCYDPEVRKPLFTVF